MNTTPKLKTITKMKTTILKMRMNPMMIAPKIKTTHKFKTTQKVKVTPKTKEEDNHKK